MTRRYVTQQVGVLDGTVIPPLRADGRQVNAKKRVLVCSMTAVAAQIADDLVLGELPANALITDIKILTDTTLGSTTIAIGISGNTGKYVAARTYTTPLNAPTSIGPKPAVLAAGPVTAKETLLCTFAAAALAGTEVISFIIEYVTNN
jgi:hypothetical protein